MNELKKDTDHVFSLIGKNHKIDGMTHEDVMQAIMNTFNSLYSEDGFFYQRKNSMVISIMHQLLVQILIKRLINLMTAEAVIFNNKNKMDFYMEHYLCEQTHFSLREVITKLYRALKQSEVEHSARLEL